jgi:hypothetical protein
MISCAANGWCRIPWNCWWRSGEIDSPWENNPETTLGLIHETLKRIRFVIHKLKQQGFHEVVMAADHGFFLNLQAAVGVSVRRESGLQGSVAPDEERDERRHVRPRILAGPVLRQRRCKIITSVTMVHYPPAKRTGNGGRRIDNRARFPQWRGGASNSASGCLIEA